MYISVLVANYNNIKYIKDCVDSLINQSFNSSKFEIIVYDDCSNDGSYEILKGYGNKIKLVRGIENIGLSLVRGELIKLSSKKTTHILFVDGDDWVDKDILSELVKTAKEYPNNIAACGTLRKNKIKSTSRGGRISIINVTQHSKLWPKENLANVKWPSRLKNEDDYALPWALGDKEFIINKNAIYHHRVVEGSISTIKDKDNARRLVDLALLNWPINDRNLSLLHHYASMEGAGKYYKKRAKEKHITRPKFIKKIKYIGFKRTFADFWTDILF